MKKIILTALIAFGVSYFHAQEVYPCHTDQKRWELMESLSPQQKTEFQEDRNTYEQEIQGFIASHPELLSNSEVNSRGTISYTIPIVFHILHQNGSENISDQQVFDAVEFMNLDYQKMNSDLSNTVAEFVPIVADVEIEFKLAKLDPNGNCTNGITRTYSLESSSGNGTSQVNAIKAAQGNWPGDEYLNIFVCKDIGGAAGYTMYPSTWMGSSMNNGIFVLYSYCGGTEAASGTTKHTLSHEAGHWLNLPHAWGDSNDPGVQSNCGMDDGVADTPLTAGWTTCNLQGTTCDGSLDNVQNFMEYSYCSTMFTNGQKARMHAALNNSVGGRNNIWSAANLSATGVNLPDILCTADFNSNLQELCVGQEVQFSDMSYSNVSGWNWEFEGGTPATSTQQNPTIAYNTPGTYQVKLTATDGTNNVSEVKQSYITVLPSGVALPFHEGFENITNMGSSDFWDVENPGGNAKWEITSDAGYTGNKSVKLANFGQQKENIDAFISSPIDLSEITSEEGVTLSFRYAYRKRSSNNSEKLAVSISNSCGTSWAQRKTLIGNQLGSDNASSAWTPSSQNDWVTVHMANVTSQFWVDNFRVKFEFESDRGNNLFIDDINIYSGSEEDDPLSVMENELIQGFNVYPNPASHTTNVAFSTNKAQKAVVSLTNMMGQTIQTSKIQAQAGKNIVSMGTEHIGAGVYLVTVSLGNTKQVQRLIIQ